MLADGGRNWFHVANAVAETLEELGLDVDTLPAARVNDL